MQLAFQAHMSGVLTHALRNAGHRQDACRRSADVAVTSDPRRGVTQVGAALASRVGFVFGGGHKWAGQCCVHVCCGGGGGMQMQPCNTGCSSCRRSYLNSACCALFTCFALQIERREKVKADAKLEAERAELLRVAGSK